MSPKYLTEMLETSETPETPEDPETPETCQGLAAGLHGARAAVVWLLGRRARHPSIREETHSTRLDTTRMSQQHSRKPSPSKVARCCEKSIPDFAGETQALAFSIVRRLGCFVVLQLTKH